MKRIIVPMGYMGSGSSAITDLISEFRDCQNEFNGYEFEDLIYNYDKKVKEITKFLGFKESDHINKKTRFNPDIFIKNTQLFRKEEYHEESKIIEKKLKDYLYDFLYEINNDVKETVEFDWVVLK